MGFDLPVLISEQIRDELLDSLEGKGVTITSMDTPEILARDILKALQSKGTEEDRIGVIQSSWKVLIEQIRCFISSG